MLDDKLARIKRLIVKREEIDAELSQLLGITEKPRRGRPPKDAESNDKFGATQLESSPSSLT